MSEYAYFYNSQHDPETGQGDRIYDADDMTDWLKPFFVTGIFNGQMQVTANDDMTVTVAPGYCNVGGKVKNFQTQQTFDLETASGTLDRIDSIMVRRDDTDRDIKVIVVRGGYAEHPVAPSVVRTGGKYDLKLCDIYVAAGSIKVTQDNITDTRADSAQCGWVVATVTEIDFDQITAQFNAYFARYQAMITSQYAIYMAYIENKEAQGDAAYQSMVNTFLAYQTEQKTRFNELYEEMKDLIGEATAAMLQNEIDTINNTIGVMAKDLATKLMFNDMSAEQLQSLDVVVTNTDTGDSEQYTVDFEHPILLTAHGDYTVEAAEDGHIIVPNRFTLDHTKTTETVNFNIYGNSSYLYVGGYVGAFVASNE